MGDLSSLQRPIARSYGIEWGRMRREQKASGGTTLLFGEWSGYSGGQRRLCHVDHIDRKTLEGFVLREILFTDRTTLRVWTEQMTCEQILERGLAKKDGYGELLRKAIAAGVEYFTV